MKDLPGMIVPWIPFEAATFLDERLRSNMRVFEWGSGLSTIWFAARVECVITVEHWDRYWKLLMVDIEKFEVQNIDPYFVLPRVGRICANPDIDHPDNYFGHRYERVFDDENFKAYVEVIDSFPNDHFDVVFIDGQARSACLQHGPSKVKVGGFLVFDNSDRKRHFKFAKFPGALWETHVFVGLGPDYGKTGKPWECTIWERTV